MRGQAIGKVKTDCTRTAAKMLKGSGVLPPCEATASAQRAQLVSESSDDSKAELSELIERAMGVEERLIIKPKHLETKLGSLRLGAQPGGSACRNDALKALSEVKGGLRAMTRWTQLWADGRVPRGVAKECLEQVIRPIKKDNGKPRNISLMEGLFKVASAAIQEAIRKIKPKPGDNPEGLEWTQYGGQPAGPELMLMVHQGMMRLRPDLAYCSLDAENAYPTAKRSAMLRGAIEWCPWHAKFLANQWKASNKAWIEVAPGKWDSVQVVEGTAQGDTSSTPAFSRGLRVALRSAAAEFHAEGIWSHIPSLVDDMVLVTQPEHVDRALRILQEHLRAIGLRLNFQKCACYIPAQDKAVAAEEQLIKSIEMVRGGLPALGSAYAGEYAALLGREALASAPGKKRLEEAHLLAQECAKYGKECRADDTKQAAWHILQSVVSKALVYDVRTLEPSESIPLAESLDSEIALAAQALLGTDSTEGWTPETTKQLQWCPEQGGMGFGSAAMAARVGRIASIAQCLPTAREHLKKILPEAPENDIYNAIPLEEVEEQLKWLKEKWGIEVGVSGDLAKEKEPRWEPRKHFQAMSKLTSVLMKELQRKERVAYIQGHRARKDKARKEAASLRNEQGTRADEYRREAEAHTRHIVRLQSASGKGVHEWVRAAPVSEKVRFNDVEFTIAAKWRLGLPVMTEQTCKIKSKDDRRHGRPCCGKMCDRLGDHAVLCGKGGGRYRNHTALETTLGVQAKQAGMEVEQEEVCEELLQGTPGDADAIEARMDLHLWSHCAELKEEWVDVTVTNPYRSKMKEQACGDGAEGLAAEDAEQRKRDRYGAGRGGTVCTPFGVEMWGRLGSSAHDLFERLAALHARRSRTRTSSVLRRWLAEMGVALYRAMAETIRQAGRTHGESADAGTDAESESPSEVGDR